MRKRRIVPWLLAFAVVAAGFGLTRQKAQEVHKINAKVVEVGNIGYGSMELNPLREDQYPKLSQTVKEYYATLRKDSGFIEYYDNVRVYTKHGKTAGTYIAFVTYEMKIKDIYTKVPGLGTLYITKENMEEDTYRIEKDKHSPQVKQCVAALSEHEDVQELLAEVNARYEQAVNSDALLKEALTDLKNAYERQAESE